MTRTMRVSTDKQVWFLADCHFNHNKEFCYLPRLCGDVLEMNNRIIENYNKVVGENDIVFFLGDFAFGTDFQSIWEICNRLQKGEKYLIIGNHDTDKKLDFYEEIGFFKEMTYGMPLRYGKRNFFLSHYPMLTNRPELWNICGHEHSENPIAAHRPYSLQIAMEWTDCRPFSIEGVKEITALYS